LCELQMCLAVSIGYFSLNSSFLNLASNSLPFPFLTLIVFDDQQVLVKIEYVLNIDL